jgi:hypothetical protein
MPRQRWVRPKHIRQFDAVANAGEAVAQYALQRLQKNPFAEEPACANVSFPSEINGDLKIAGRHIECDGRSLLPDTVDRAVCVIPETVIVAVGVDINCRANGIEVSRISSHGVHQYWKLRNVGAIGANQPRISLICRCVRARLGELYIRSRTGGYLSGVFLSRGLFMIGRISQSRDGSSGL